MCKCYSNFYVAFSRGIGDACSAVRDFYCLNALIAIHLGLRPPPLPPQKKKKKCSLSVTFYNMETPIVPLRRDQVLVGVDKLNWALIIFH